MNKYRELKNIINFQSKKPESDAKRERLLRLQRISDGIVGVVMILYGVGFTQISTVAAMSPLLLLPIGTAWICWFGLSMYTSQYELRPNDEYERSQWEMSRSNAYDILKKGVLIGILFCAFLPYLTFVSILLILLGVSQLVEAKGITTNHGRADTEK